LVDDLDPKTVHALQYTRTIRCERTIAVHLEEDPARAAALAEAWEVAGLADVPLRIVRGTGDEATRLGGLLAAYARDDRDVIVIVPVPHAQNAFERLSDRRAGARLNRALHVYPNVRVTLVRDHPDGPRRRSSRRLLCTGPGDRPPSRLAAGAPARGRAAHRCRTAW